MFISFEGIDGCGKTTQLKLLNDYLNELGYKVIAVREPGGTPLSEKIREILLNKNNNISNIAELLLFEAARAELIHNIIKPACNEGVFVLTDRFIDSTLAYQGYGRGLDTNYINILNTIATEMLIPDITFYLQLPLSIVKQRYSIKKLDRIEQLGEVFLQKVIDGFDIIASNNTERIIIIDATQSIEKVFQNIKNKLKI
ncbi:MAG: dTMP kinase [Bacteroidetes bacterium]|nr:dTMP kinase [Bacteroidota bacterium]